VNDKLKNALDNLASDVSEAGVWQELQERVSSRRRRNRTIQGVLGVLTVLAIGIGASGLLRGDGSTDFVEQATTTTTAVGTSTTTTASTPQTTTSFVPEPVAIDPNEFLGETMWGVYLYVGDPETAESDKIMASFADNFATWGIPHREPVRCDQGLPIDAQSTDEAIAFYYREESTARLYAEHLDPAPLAVWEIVRTCDPALVQSTNTLTVYGLKMSAVVEPEFTVAGQTITNSMVSIAGVTVETTDGYFETTIRLVEGLNTIEVEVPGTELRETITVTYLPDALRQFAYIGEFTGEFVVDYAEFLTGEAANQAARAAGEIGDDETVPNDFFIRNVNPQWRGLALADDAPIYVLGFDDEGGIKPVLVDRAEFEAMFSGDFNPVDWYGGDPRQLPYWLIIEGETILQIEQQYLP
jgi:hypothetical protein